MNICLCEKLKSISNIEQDITLVTLWRPFKFCMIMMLNNAENAKYLGVSIDSRLSFNNHIDNVAKKANSIRAFIYLGQPSYVHSRSGLKHLPPTQKAPVGIFLISMNPHWKECSTKSIDRTSSVTSMLQQLKYVTGEEG